MEEVAQYQAGSVGSNQAEFTRQATTFAQSPVLGAPEQILPVLKAADIQPQDRVLDVGCGTGFLLVGAAAQAAQVVGLDATPAMLAEARQRVEGAGWTNVTLREGNAESLPFADERFDVVLNRLTLHHLANPQRVLAEIHRVLRPGGRLALCDIVAASDAAKADLHNRLERLRDPSHVQHYSTDTVLKMVEGAGFSVTGCEHWKTLRHFGEWVGLASVRSEVMPALRVLLESMAEGDCGGIQARRAPDGELTFIHHWLVVSAVK